MRRLHNTQAQSTASHCQLTSPTGESDCSRMLSKVSSGWLPGYIKATQPVLKIFRMAATFWSTLVYQYYRMLLKSYDDALTTFIQIC